MMNIPDHDHLTPEEIREIEKERKIAHYRANKEKYKLRSKRWRKTPHGRKSYMAYQKDYQKTHLMPHMERRSASKRMRLKIKGRIERLASALLALPHTLDSLDKVRNMLKVLSPKRGINQYKLMMKPK